MHATYSIKDDSAHILSSGELYSGALPVGKNIPLGMVEFPLNSVTKPAKLTLTVQFSSEHSNQWDFWVYPEPTFGAEIPKGIFLTDTLDAKAQKVLDKGGKVLLTAAGRVTLGSDVASLGEYAFENCAGVR